MDKLIKIQQLLGNKGELLIRTDAESGKWFVHLFRCTDEPIVQHKVEFATGGTLEVAANSESLIKGKTDDLDAFLDQVINILENGGM